MKESFICKKCEFRYKFKTNNAQAYNGKIFICKKCGFKQYISIDETIILDEDFAVGIGMLSIHLKEGAEEEIFILEEGPNMVGRFSESNEVQLSIYSKDKKLSREHFCIEGIVNNNQQIEFIIWDNKSKNGTFLNDKELLPNEELYLQNEDQIKAGDTLFYFQLK